MPQHDGPAALRMDNRRGMKGLTRGVENVGTAMAQGESRRT